MALSERRSNRQNQVPKFRKDFVAIILFRIKLAASGCLCSYRRTHVLLANSVWFHTYDAVAVTTEKNRVGFEGFVTKWPIVLSLKLVVLLLAVWSVAFCIDNNN